MRLRILSIYWKAQNKNKNLYGVKRLILLVIPLLLSSIVGCSLPFIPTAASTPATNSSTPFIITPQIITPSPISTTPPTSTPTTPPTSTPTTNSSEEFDFHLGYVTDRTGCQLMTEIVELVLEQEWTLNVERTPYGSANDMFDAVSTGNMDLTVCFMSPEDDPLWSDDEKFGHIKLMGSSHWQDESNNKWRIVAKLSVRSDLRKNHPDLFCFFEKLKFSELVFQDVEAQQWIENHNDDIQSWLNGCR